MMRLMRGLIWLLGVMTPAILIGLLVLLILADVIARNVFSTALLWAHDLAVILLAATVWLGLAGAARAQQLFGIDIIIDRLPERARLFTRIFADILVILIAGGVIHAAWAQITTARFTTFLSLGWPKWIVAAFLAIGMAMIILNSILDMVERYRGDRA